jgi:cytochrome c biogenesis protein CcmG/thiol:disulfide interchange protein DsbE
MMRFTLPLVVFLILAAFLYKGLGRDTREVPSPLVGKAAPAFVLPTLYEVNVWASWCGACKDEHPILMELAKQNLVPVVGMDYKDKREDGQATLSKAGDPYTLIVSDADGKVGFDYGVYGVPETYVIDKKGTIAYKLIGALSAQNLSEIILPMVAELQAK